MTRRTVGIVSGAALVVLTGLFWLRAAPLPAGLLDERDSTSTTVVDRRGVVLYEARSRDGMRGTSLAADALPPNLVQGVTRGRRSPVLQPRGHRSDGGRPRCMAEPEGRRGDRGRIDHHTTGRQAVAGQARAIGQAGSPWIRQQASGSGCCAEAGASALETRNTRALSEPCSVWESDCRSRARQPRLLRDTREPAHCGPGNIPRRAAAEAFGVQSLSQMATGCRSSANHHQPDGGTRACDCR